MVLRLLLRFLAAQIIAVKNAENKISTEVGTDDYFEGDISMVKVCYGLLSHFLVMAKLP